MKTVLITRSKAQSESLALALEKFGLRVEYAPMIEIVPRTDWQPPHVSRYNGFVFTSQNAVRLFFERLDLGSTQTIFPNIFVVGEKTRLALHSFGLDAAVVPEKFSAENLAALFSSLAVEHQTFLFVCGNLSRPTIPDAIRALGGRCDTLVVYDTVKPKDADLTRLFGLFEQDGISAAAFMSPSAARHFYEFGLFENMPTSIIVAAIGETTADALRGLGVRVDVVPSVSTEEHFAEAIAMRLQNIG